MTALADQKPTIEVSLLLAGSEPKMNLFPEVAVTRTRIVFEPASFIRPGEYGAGVLRRLHHGVAVFPTALVDLMNESPRLRTVLALIDEGERGRLVSFVESASSDTVRCRRAALVAMTLAGHRGGR